MRLEDWQARLASEVENWRNVPFAWGSADCLAFATACEVAIVGHSLFEDVGAYSSPKGASRVLRGMGERKAVRVLDERKERVAVNLARRGDWILTGGRVAFFGALGVVVGRNALVMTQAGLAPYPMAQAVRAWKVE
jgi:hypothetical protein